MVANTVEISWACLFRSLCHHYRFVTSFARLLMEPLIVRQPMRDRCWCSSLSLALLPFALHAMRSLALLAISVTAMARPCVIFLLLMVWLIHRRFARCALCWFCSAAQIIWLRIWPISCCKLRRQTYWSSEQARPLHLDYQHECVELSHHCRSQFAPELETWFSGRNRMDCKVS